MANETTKALLDAINNLNANVARLHQTSTPETPIINDRNQPANSLALQGNNEDWQIVIFEPEDVAAGDTTQVSQRIPESYHFDLIYITGRLKGVEQDVETDQEPNIDLKIFDAGSDQYLVKDGNWIHWQNIIGSAPTAANALTWLATPNAPYTIAGRRRFPATTTIGMEFRNNLDVTARIQVAFHGIKTFTKFEK